MNLENVLRQDPNSLLQESVLSNILQQISFQKFFINILRYPDLYQKLSTYQSFWRLYLNQKYHSVFFKLSSKSNVNWFYETIIAAHENEVKYYYTSEKDNTLSSYIPNFQKYNYKIPGTNDYKSYTDKFNTDNELDISNLTQTTSNLNRGYVSPGQSNIPTSSRRIEQIIAIDEIQFYILFSDGDLMYLDGKTQSTILKDVKKMFLKKEQYHNYYFIFLTNSGYLYRKRKNKDMIKLITPSDGRIKDAQLDGDMISFIDTLNNIYSIDFSDDERDYSGYISGVMSRIQHEPFLKGILVNSFLFIHHGSSREIGLPTGMPGRRIGLVTTLFYATTDGKLFSVRYEDYVRVGNPVQTSTFNNVKVKKFYTIRMGRMRLHYEEVDFYFYQDIDDNVYKFNVYDNNTTKYQLPENLHIKQFVPGPILNFVTDTGRIYYYDFDHPYNREIVPDVNNPSTQKIENIPIENSKDFPPGTKIITSGEEGTIIEIPQSTGYIMYPYPLYLLQLFNRNVVDDEVKDDQIIFHLKDGVAGRQPYNFSTKNYD